MTSYSGRDPWEPVLRRDTGLQRIGTWTTTLAVGGILGSGLIAAATFAGSAVASDQGPGSSVTGDNPQGFGDDGTGQQGPQLAPANPVGPPMGVSQGS